MIPFVRGMGDAALPQSSAGGASLCCRAAGLGNGEVPSVAYWIPTYAEKVGVCVHWQRPDPAGAWGGSGFRGSRAV